MNPFVAFMVSPAGRIARIVASVALLLWAFLGLDGAAGVVVIIVALVPLLAGVFDVCVFAPLLGYPFNGGEARSRR